MSETNPGDTGVLETLFHQNTWANLKLLAFCEGLSADQLDVTTVGTYGSIRDTLLHVVRAEAGYVSRVNGKQPAAPPPRDHFPGFSVLADAVRWAGDELLALALAARPDTLVEQHSPWLHTRYPLAGLMTQAINHSTEHRAQVSAIITALGLEPPDMSGWAYMDAMGTLEELPASPEPGG